MSDLIEVAIKYGFVDKPEKGSWFTLFNGEKVQGQNGVRKYLEEHEDILSELEDLIEEQDKAPNA